jgi:uncharacterized membrane protein YedE/YeeE
MVVKSLLAQLGVAVGAWRIAGWYGVALAICVISLARAVAALSESC